MGRTVAREAAALKITVAIESATQSPRSENKRSKKKVRKEANKTSECEKNNSCADLTKSIGGQ